MDTVPGKLPWLRKNPLLNNIHLEKIYGLKLWNTEPILEINSLTSSLSNDTYCIVTTEHKYFARFDNINAHLFSRDRSVEAHLQKLAAEVNLAPQPIFRDIHQGFIISEYIEGDTLKIEQMEHPSTHIKFKKFFQDLYELPTNSFEVLDLEYLVESYFNQLPRSHALYAPIRQRQIRFAPLLKQLSQPQQTNKICHLDLSADNLLFTKNSDLMALDWEYAALSHPYLDLAIFYRNFNLNKETLITLTSHIFMIDWDIFALYLDLSQWLDALWFAIRGNYWKDDSNIKLAKALIQALD